jgi:[protein-PII] uridylyltransferase
VAGNKPLFRRFDSTIHAHLDVKAFFEAKLLEQQQRHSRFNDTAYNLEPNLKEGPGGLRDLVTILWISAASGTGRSWKDLSRHAVITAEEAQRIGRDERVLQDLRIRLHYHSRRREDRLVFDLQTPLARDLGLVDTPAKRSSEQLMQRYYRTARAVTQLNEIILQSLRAIVFPAPDLQPRRLDERFEAHHELLAAADPAVFEREPQAILEVFELMQRHPELKGIEAGTLRALWRSAKGIDAQFRRDPVNKERFFGMFRYGAGLTHALRRMNRYDVLGRYLAPFGRIVGQMQHDLFHVYTVDEHILMVVRNLRRFAVTDFAHEYPLCSRLMAEFERPEVLYIAGLFHDIAKGRGGDHSTLGTVDARRFCRNHGVSDEDTELIAWLVERHLYMSSVAQKRDLADPNVIAEFARVVHTDRRLAALYLLTVADIRGTSPKVWNAWKGKLLEDLYRAVRARLAGGEEAGADIAARQAEARANLALYGLPADAADALWQHLDARYFVRFDARDMAWQARMLWRLTDSPVAVVRAHLSPVGEGIQVLVYTPDRPDLFARICGFFARIQYTIVEAKIHTTRHGYALDSFQVMDLANRGIQYRDFLSFVEYELARDLDPARPLQPAPRGRLSRHQRHHPYPTTVRLEPDAQGRGHTLSITCADRAGLLFAVAEALMRHEVGVYSAKIDTLGERVEDTFLIRGETLQTPAGIAAVEAEVREALQ